MNCTHEACLSRDRCLHGIVDESCEQAHSFDPSSNYDPCTERCQFFADARLYMPQWEYRQLLRERAAVQPSQIIQAEIVKPRRKPRQEQILEAARISEQQRIEDANG